MVKSRKRQLLVDTNGLMHLVLIPMRVSLADTPILHQSASLVIGSCLIPLQRG